TAQEILADTGGAIDAFVAGVGTGGTITGVGEVLKAQIPSLLIVAVEPALSQVLAGKPPATHAIQGIGAGFVPAVLNRGLIAEVVPCEDRAAFDMAGRLAGEEGITAGISRGGAAWVAVEIAGRLGAGKAVVTV